ASRGVPEPRSGVRPRLEEVHVRRCGLNHGTGRRGSPGSPIRLPPFLVSGRGRRVGRALRPGGQGARLEPQTLSAAATTFRAAFGACAAARPRTCRRSGNPPFERPSVPHPEDEGTWDRGPGEAGPGHHLREWE